MARHPHLVFDEVYGFLPPHPANPPTKPSHPVRLIGHTATRFWRNATVGLTDLLVKETSEKKGDDER